MVATELIIWFQTSLVLKDILRKLYGKKFGRMRQKLAFQKNLLKLLIMQNKYSPFSADL